MKAVAKDVKKARRNSGRIKPGEKVKARRIFRHRLADADRKTAWTGFVAPTYTGRDIN